MKWMLVAVVVPVVTAAGQVPLVRAEPWSGLRFQAQRALRLAPDAQGSPVGVGGWMDLSPLHGRTVEVPLWDCFEGCPRDSTGNPVGADVGEAGWNFPYPLTEGSCEAENVGLGYRWTLGDAYHCPHVAVDIQEAVAGTDITSGCFGLWYNPVNPTGMMVVLGTWDEMGTAPGEPAPGGGQLGGFLGGWLLDYGPGPQPGPGWHIFTFEVPSGVRTPADGSGALELHACEHAEVDGEGRLTVTPFRTTAPNSPNVVNFTLWGTGESRTPQDLTRVGRSTARQLNDSNPADGVFQDLENESLDYGVNPNPLGAMIAVFGNPEPGCVADFNGDGFLDFFDYDDFVSCFETAVCPPGTTADFNGDGFADFFDYDDFVTRFETGC